MIYLWMNLTYPPSTLQRLGDLQIGGLADMFAEKFPIVSLRGQVSASARVWTQGARTPIGAPVIYLHLCFGNYEHNSPMHVFKINGSETIRTFLRHYKL